MREGNAQKIEVHVSGLCFYDKKILVAKRNSRKEFYPGLWECGGGQVRNGETFEEAIQRKLKQELGITVRIIKPLGTYFIPYPSSEQKKIPGIKFICEIDSFLDGKNPKITEEHSEFRFLSREEIEDTSLEFIPGVRNEIRQAFSEIY